MLHLQFFILQGPWCSGFRLPVWAPAPCLQFAHLTVNFFLSFGIREIVLSYQDARTAGFIQTWNKSNIQAWPN